MTHRQQMTAFQTYINTAGWIFLIFGVFLVISGLIPGGSFDAVMPGGLVVNK